MNTTVDKLSREITRKNSRQTYLTILLLVDRSMVSECYKAYAYFRWLDDQVDTELKSSEERTSFIERQFKIINAGFKGTPPITNATAEEELLISLIQSNPNPNTKLARFIYNFFAVIKFDAKRKDKLISQPEFTWYTETLGKAVTECIEYFIGNNQCTPPSAYHYSAATAAHITHMLRDYKEDLEQGYKNMPKEYRSQRDWVHEEVVNARQQFHNGKKYIYSLPNFRLKLVALWYCDRFEWILNTIVEDQYVLRTNYYQKKHFTNLLYYLNTFISLTLRHYL